MSPSNNMDHKKKKKKTHESIEYNYKGGQKQLKSKTTGTSSHMGSFFDPVMYLPILAADTLKFCHIGCPLGSHHSKIPNQDKTHSKCTNEISLAFRCILSKPSTSKA